MFTLFAAILKGIFLSILLWVGSALSGRLICRNFSATIVHHMVMFVVAVITCVLITSYSVTSSLQNTVQKYGSILVQGSNLVKSSAQIKNSDDYIAAVSQTLKKEYPLVADRVTEWIEGNEALRTNVAQILASNSTDKATQVTKYVSESFFKDIMKKFSATKWKILIAIIILQLAQLAMIVVAANNQGRRNAMINAYNYNNDYI